MSRHPSAAAPCARLLFAIALSLAAFAASASETAADAAPPRKPKDLGTVEVVGTQPTSLPTQIPTTMEGISGEEVETRINATDAEDALKYFPSLLVRKRYIGDYDHAVLATRASGTGNSARSLVYADGIPLSNLLGNGASFTPRWGLVSPEEIERVDVLYGPFSAAYPGNSVGAVVDYVTRMPERFEAHAKTGYYVEDFELYRTNRNYAARAFSASIGDRIGDLSLWLSLQRLDSEAHPIAYANLLASAGSNGSGVPVDGEIAGENPRRQPWYLLGATGQTNTLQDHAKLKLAYDFAPDLRLSYVLGLWKNEAFRDSETWLHDAAGNPIYSGNVQIDGRRYTIPATAISLQRADLQHRMQGLSLRRSRGGEWDFAIGLSRYDYLRDRLRSPTVARPVADSGGTGRIADSEGTGWTTASLAFTWRPNAAHVLEFGLQDDRHRLRTRVFDTTNWIEGEATTRYSAFGGRTGLRSVFVQDTWRGSERWTATLGLRHERWRAHDGLLANAASEFGFPERSETAFSPKAAFAYALTPDWSLQASIGRALRFPTVSELYQGSIATNVVVNNDPNLKPERSVTSELSLIRRGERSDWRVTVFHERTRDALYSQTNVTVFPNVTNIQNVDAIRTSGLELAGHWFDLVAPGLDLDASLTFADSIIRENRNFPASVGRWQPRVPRWRANLVANYRTGEHWSFTAAARYSGRQFNTLDNSDTNSETYTGTSPFLVLDLRTKYRHDRHWSASLGVDNLGNRTYWNFHPYNQRTWAAELRYDY